MADVHSPETRSRNMAAIRGLNTKPELQLRRALFAHGFRYRLHDRRLPGKPDLVLPKHRAVIFVHGCFFHGHECATFRWPGTRKGFWRRKIVGNRLRDQATVERLLDAGWRVLIVWECAIRGRKGSAKRAAASASKWLFRDDPLRVIPDEVNQ